MPLHSAHSGYIYQDLLTTYYILKEILEERASVIHVDRKHVIDDRFDDIVIERNEAIFRKQVKYSDGKKRHILQKSDLSSDANYNLALHSLYHCWEKYPTNEHNEIRICLGWSLPAPEDELWNILLPLDDYRTFQEHSTSVFKIDVDVLWDEKTGPLPSWRKFSHESASIKRVKFCNFLDHLLIEVNFPKASLDIDRPGELERIVLQQTERLGLGEYPNEDVSPKETILYLTHLVQKARADSQQLALNDLFKRLGIRTDFGRVKQVFPVRDEELIETTDTVDLVRNIIQNHNKIILSGEPGAGKSWLIHNLERALGDEFVFVKHYCYTDLHDEFQVERIKENTLYGNLISDILIAFPELKERKQKKYASNLNELNLLLKHIQKPTLLIVD